MSRTELLGTFEQVVLLAALGTGERASIPDVRTAVERILERAVTRGAVYVTLDRLERRALITSDYDDATPARGGRPRRYVRATPAARAALEHARGVLGRGWSALDGEVSR